MLQLIPIGWRVSALVLLALLGTWLGSYISWFLFGEEPSWPWLARFTISFITVLLIPAAEYLWPVVWSILPPLSRWAPNLNGTWTGELKFRWPPDSPEMTTRPTTVIIRQGLFSIGVRLETVESTSSSFPATLDRHNGSFRLIYTYDNEPRGTLLPHSPRHYGTAKLELDASGKRLTGSYFTGRQTLGDIELRRTSRKSLR